LCVFRCSCHFLLLWLAAICFLDALSQEISDVRHTEMCSLPWMICDQAGGLNIAETLKQSTTFTNVLRPLICSEDATVHLTCLWHLEPQILLVEIGLSIKKNFTSGYPTLCDLQLNVQRSRMMIMMMMWRRSWGSLTWT
jgi:hypothetical protein